MKHSRSVFLGAVSAFGAASLIAPLAARAANVSLAMRWYGGGVYELATPDDSQIVLVDAWIWNNTGFKQFNKQKPPDLSSAAAYVAALKARKPKNVFVLLTHDHGDHAGDYVELLKALSTSGLDFKTAGQAELMRGAYVPAFKAAGLDPAAIVVNNGNGLNFGGAATFGDVTVHLVPAVHSTTTGAPPAGYIIDMAGTRIYASGDTDEFGDMSLIRQRYHPVLAVLCAGGGPFTMDPETAADAAKMLGVEYAIPVHYAHNPLVIGPGAGPRFKAALAKIAPDIRTTIFTPGERVMLSLPAAT
jgi:L-ascorbate metabolism protein UlaG (beta-lactamase superfamily)